MKIGIDIDGVLANFIHAYQSRIVAITGEDKFLPGDIDNPPCWDWPELRGYTAAEIKTVWAQINTDLNFWFGLNPLDDVRFLAQHWNRIDEAHEVTFVTNRPGVNVRHQTEEWLSFFLMPEKTPHVVVVGKGAKGDVCKHMGLDAYVDDAYENAVDVVQRAPKTRGYLISRSYNQYEDLATKKLAKGEAAYSELQKVESLRIASLGEFLRSENLVPYLSERGEAARLGVLG